MSTASLATPLLITAEQFAQRPDPGYPEELVRGRIVPLLMPKPRHGEICNKAGRIFGNFVEDHDLGRVFCNHTGVVTERRPDTVRGADISFYSYAPRSRKALCPTDIWTRHRTWSSRFFHRATAGQSFLAKVAEYLDAGTTVVLVLDDERRLAHVYRDDRAPRRLAPMTS